MRDLDREHPQYVARKAMWQTYRDLYAGGEQLKARADSYLRPRQKEPVAVYQERLSRVFYENYIGSIIDWYAATLFRREPIVVLEGDDEVGRRFFAGFTEDCDRRGTSLSDFFRRLLVDALVAGVGLAVVDFPRASRRPVHRAEEEALGLARAYLVRYAAEELVNWEHDENGNYEWVVLRTAALRQREPGKGDWKQETTWVYYDKTDFEIQRAWGGERGPQARELVARGRHGLAALRQVPMFELRVSEGLWLMNKAALLQLEHFNKSNALSWAITMGLFAMPVVYSEREFRQIVGESYYIQLGPEDRFGWTEPEGKVYQVAMENLGRLKNEIYRVCYLLTQAGGGLSGMAPQSGLSKQRDFSITQEVLRAYGDAVKDSMKRVLRAIAAARQDEIRVGVSGLDEFDIGDFGAELSDAERLLRLGAGSQTLKKEVLRRLAFKYLCDASQEVKERIAREIEGVAGESCEKEQ